MASCKAEETIMRIAGVSASASQALAQQQQHQTQASTTAQTGTTGRT
jgi:hypothetical protein